MTKEKIMSKIQHALRSLSGVVYLYIGGSFNTPFFNDSSDIDLMLVWNVIPDIKSRNELLSRIKRQFNTSQEWTFLDKNGSPVRDAIKLHNFRKIEIYHHDFATFQNLLTRQNEVEGLAFSIANRMPLLESSEIEAFINNFTPNLIHLKRNLYFSIMSDFKKESLNEKSIEHILQLFAIHTYSNMPSRKHWDKVLNLIPKNSLLKELRLNDWVAQSLELLLKWSDIAPSESFESSDHFQLKKLTCEHNAEIFRIIQSQKERLQQYLSWPTKIQTIEDQNEFSRRANIQWQQGIAFHYQIFHKDIFVGGLSIHSLNYNHRCFEFGYWIDHSSEGRGLITKGLEILLQDLKKIGWQSAKITSNIKNTRSQRVAKRLGMTLHNISEQFAVYSLDLT